MEKPPTERVPEENNGLFDHNRRFPLIAYGCKMKIQQVERLREAATIVNEIKKQNLFEIEIIDTTDKTEGLEPGVVWAKIVGKWLAGPVHDASELWRTKRELDAQSSQG